MANVPVLENPGTTGANDAVETIAPSAAEIPDSTNIGPADITLATVSRGLVLTAPATETLLQGNEAAISGVTLSDSYFLRGAIFSVSVSDENGLLSAAGAGVSGAGSTNLLIVGTLAQVNAALATLSDTDDFAAPGGAFDLISIAATDGFGNQAANQIGVTAYSLTPVIAAPTAEQILPQGSDTAIPGVRLSEANAVAKYFP